MTDSTTDKVELLPCPFCGASSAGVSRMTVTPDGYKVRCNTCFARTQDERSEQKAIEAWNTRAQHVQSPSEQVELGSDLELAIEDWRISRHHKGLTTEDSEDLALVLLSIITKHVQPTSVIGSCKLGEALLHGSQSYRWCQTHDRLMLTCETSPSLTDAIEAVKDYDAAKVAAEAMLLVCVNEVKRLRDGWEQETRKMTPIEAIESAETHYVDAADEIIITLQSLEGKAPVGEQRLHCSCGAAVTWEEYAKHLRLGHDAATTPSSGEE